MMSESPCRMKMENIRIFCIFSKNLLDLFSWSITTCSHALKFNSILKKLSVSFLFLSNPWELPGKKGFWVCGKRNFHFQILIQLRVYTKIAGLKQTYFGGLFPIAFGFPTRKHFFPRSLTHFTTVHFIIAEKTWKSTFLSCSNPVFCSPAI